MYEDTLEEWLEGYMSWDNGEEDGEIRMSRKTYFKKHFPKEYDYMPQWEQLQRLRKELRENDAIRNYCSDHNKYFRLTEKCPECH